MSDSTPLQPIEPDYSAANIKGSRTITLSTFKDEPLELEHQRFIRAVNAEYTTPPPATGEAKPTSTYIQNGYPQGAEAVSLCKWCWAMTHTVGGMLCGKCGKAKEAEGADPLRPLNIDDYPEPEYNGPLLAALIHHIQDLEKRVKALEDDVWQIED